MSDTRCTTCPDCGSPMVLDADEFMLGTLTCPCCDIDTANDSFIDEPEDSQQVDPNELTEFLGE